MKDWAHTASKADVHFFGDFALSAAVIIVHRISFLSDPEGCDPMYLAPTLDFGSSCFFGMRERKTIHVFAGYLGYKHRARWAVLTT